MQQYSVVYGVRSTVHGWSIALALQGGVSGARKQSAFPPSRFRCAFPHKGEKERERRKEKRKGTHFFTKRYSPMSASISLYRLTTVYRENLVSIRTNIKPVEFRGSVCIFGWTNRQPHSAQEKVRDWGRPLLGPALFFLSFFSSPGWWLAEPRHARRLLCVSCSAHHVPACGPSRR